MVEWVRCPGGVIARSVSDETICLFLRFVMSIEQEIHGRFSKSLSQRTDQPHIHCETSELRIYAVAQKHDMTDQQYNVLRVLRGYRDKGPQNIGFIKEHMLDKQSDMSRIIDRLYEKGMVSREENPEDRRQKLVEITDKGLKLLDEMFDCEKSSDRLLSNLSLEEIDQLNKLLDKVREK